MITENYVSFEMAKLLKEKGFDEESWCAYNLVTKKFAREIVDWNFRYNHGLPNYVASAPTLQMAMKWLREVHNLDIIVPPQFDNSKWTYSAIIFKLSIPCTEIRLNDNKDKKEEACDAAIKYCLENLI